MPRGRTPYAKRRTRIRRPLKRAELVVRCKYPREYTNKWLVYPNAINAAEATHYYDLDGEHVLWKRLQKKDVIPGPQFCEHWSEYSKLFTHYRVKKVHMYVQLDADRIFGVDEDSARIAGWGSVDTYTEVLARFRRHIERSAKFAYVPHGTEWSHAPTRLLVKDENVPPQYHVNKDQMRTVKLSTRSKTDIQFDHIMYKEQVYSAYPAEIPTPGFMTQNIPVKFPWRRTDGNPTTTDPPNAILLPDYGILFDQTMMFDIIEPVPGSDPPTTQRISAGFTVNLSYEVDLEFRGRRPVTPPPDSEE